MIDIHGPVSRLCDGILRRDFLKVGALGAFGLSLPSQLRAEQSPRSGESTTAVKSKIKHQKSAILIWLQGGPSQHDTFDPKPDAPSEIRGPFKPISTTVPGIQIAEVFPKLARHADKFALLRSVFYPGAGVHIVGHQYMLCGMGNGSIAYPNMAAVIANIKGHGSLLPPWVLLPNIAYETNATAERLCQTSGYLGAEYNAVIPQGDLVKGTLALENLDPPQTISQDRLTKRRELLTRIPAPKLGDAARNADAVYGKALEIMDSRGVRQAFDLRKEPDRLRDRYGRNHVGQGALLARRLVEAGTRFVTVNWPNRLAWDVHTDLEGQMRNHLCPTLDRALATLLDDLHQRGMLETTMVIAMGEMGRTPKLGNSDPNYADGRDHWGSVMSVLVAGGGVRGGQVIGSSDEIGAYVKDRPIPSHDLVATVYHAFGISPDEMVRTVGGQPKRVLEKGEAVRELFA